MNLNQRPPAQSNAQASPFADRAVEGLPANEISAADIELMRRVAGRQGDALAELYDQYSARVFGLCIFILGENQLAEDILQDVFLQAWEQARFFEPAHIPVTTWLMTIARNACTDQLRRMRASPPAAGQPDGHGAQALDQVLAGLENDVRRPAGASERDALVRRALAALAPEQRLVIELSFFKGLTRQAIARQLDWPAGTVETQARLALQNLRGRLDEFDR